jgi:putative flippase GtrA
MPGQFGRIMRFAVVGGAATLTYAGSALILSYGPVSAILPAVAASFLAYLIAMPVSYFGHKRLTFGSDRTHALEMPRFLGSAILGIAIASLLPLIVVDGLDLAPAVSIVLACILVPATNYVALERWVFAAEERGAK